MLVQSIDAVHRARIPLLPDNFYAAWPIEAFLESDNPEDRDMNLNVHFLVAYPHTSLLLVATNLLLSYPGRAYMYSGTLRRI